MATFNRFWGLIKLQRMLIGLGWRIFLLGYFCVGAGALAVIFLIETRFFSQFADTPMQSYILAGIFESAKVGTSLIKQALTIARRVSRVRVSALLQGVTALFQLALVTLSLICTVMVITAYLEGTYEDRIAIVETGKASGPQVVVSRSSHVMVTSAVRLLQENFGFNVTASVCISVFAVLISGLLQGTIYIVFGHILATQASEIEHIFTVKLHKADTKKNSMTNI